MSTITDTRILEGLYILRSKSISTKPEQCMNAGERNEIGNGMTKGIFQRPSTRQPSIVFVRYWFFAESKRLCKIRADDGATHLLRAFATLIDRDAASEEGFPTTPTQRPFSAIPLPTQARQPRHSDGLRNVSTRSIKWLPGWTPGSESVGGKKIATTSGVL